MHDVHRAEPVAHRLPDTLCDRGHAPLVIQRGGTIHRRHLGDGPTRSLLQIGRDDRHVAERRRRQQHLAVGELQQRNLPRPAPVDVAVVVELVKTREPEIARRTRHQCVVGEHLGGAHQHRCAHVDRRVARRQPNVRRAEEVDKIEELLGHQRLHRSRPHRTPPLVACEQHTANSHQTLARPRRRRQDHMVAGGQREHRLVLVRIQRTPSPRRPLTEHIEHGQRIRPRRREAISQRTHTDAQCGVAHELERAQPDDDSTERATTRARSSTDIARGRPRISGSSLSAEVSHHRTARPNGTAAPRCNAIEPSCRTLIRFSDRRDSQAWQMGQHPSSP